MKFTKHVSSFIRLAHFFPHLSICDRACERKKYKGESKSVEERGERMKRRKARMEGMRKLEHFSGVTARWWYIQRSFIAMKCTHVAFMYRLTRETRTCSCQFQPAKEEKTPVQLIKQKGRGRGGWKMRGKRAGNSSIRPPLPLSPGKITRNQRRLETLRFYIVHLWTDPDYFSRKFPREGERERETIWYIAMCENNYVIFLLM